ncbi:glycosyl hydrolase family 18 protein [Aquimarina spongiae]|nr:glycosyl hydrolase family 18 protein [Aquimarina spongiae]
MKLFLITIISMLLLVGCGNDSTAENENTTSKLDNVDFISQRHLHEKKFEGFDFETEQQWDSLNTISPKKVLLKKGKIHPAIRTFGWHIYSNGSSWKNYNFSMLWGISYFSYRIQPETGRYKTIHQWKTTTLIDSAKASNCKVFLSISNFGSENNAIFLKNPKAQKTLIDSVSNLLALRSADGINIDFEGVSKKDKTSFTKFIIAISNGLKQKNPNYMISLCLYAEDWNAIFDIPTIDLYVDFYTLMGYDYYGRFSKITGPVTPFNQSQKFGKGLKNSIQYYKNKGVDFNKLIVGLPYYGAQWSTKKSFPGATVSKFIDHPPYKRIKKFYMDSLQTPVQFDSISSSTYLVVKENDDEFHQLFFEDEKSLSIKYDWIKNNRLSGVGIWALGYDNGHSELWDLLTEKFSKEQNIDLYQDNSPD